MVTAEPYIAQFSIKLPMSIFMPMVATSTYKNTDPSCSHLRPRILWRA